MLELGGWTAVCREHRPAVGPGHTPVGAQGEHRLDGKGHAWPKAQAAPRPPIVRDLRRHVHLTTDAMAAILTHEPVARPARYRLDGRAHVAEAGPGPDLCDARLKRGPGGLDEPPNLRMHLTDQEGDRGIAVKAIELGGNVHVNDIPVPQDDLRRRDPVTDDLVGAHAHRRREAVKAELARPTASTCRVFSDPGVDVRRAHPGANPRAHVGQRLARRPPCGTHCLDLFTAQKFDRHEPAVPRPPGGVQYRLGMAARMRNARLEPVSLDQIRYFVTVAEEGNITRAARRLHISQPPLTRQIRALEAELGAPLLDRHPKGVSLLPTGQAFLHKAREVLRAVDAATASVSNLRTAGDRPSPERADELVHRHSGDLGLLR